MQLVQLYLGEFVIFLSFCEFVMFQQAIFVLYRGHTMHRNAIT